MRSRQNDAYRRSDGHTRRGAPSMMWFSICCRRTPMASSCPSFTDYKPNSYSKMKLYTGSSPAHRWMGMLWSQFLRPPREQASTPPPLGLWTWEWLGTSETTGHDPDVTVCNSGKIILHTFEGAEAKLAWRLRVEDLACGEEGVAGLEPRLRCGRWRMIREATETIKAAISRAAEGRGRGTMRWQMRLQCHEHGLPICPAMCCSCAQSASSSPLEQEIPIDSNKTDISALGISVLAWPCSLTSASLISKTRNSEARLSSVAAACSSPKWNMLLFSSPRECAGLPPAEGEEGASLCPFFLPRET
jgi:hypothetical protein